MKPPATLAEARDSGARHYHTGKPCIRGHIAARSTATRTCVQCDRERALRLYHEEPAKRQATSKAWKQANAEQVKAYKQSYNAANKEHQAARAKRYYSANADQLREYSLRWGKENVERKNAANGARRAWRLHAVPSWADHERIAEIYRVARLAAVDVDHIVPLNGKTVCGLHTEANLQLLPYWDNIAKGNRHWPEMWA